MIYILFPFTPLDPIELYKKKILFKNKKSILFEKVMKLKKV